MKKLMMTTMAGVFAASMSMAAITTDAIVSDFQAQGFTRVEVKVGPTQMKVEAIRGAEKVEVIYDIASGAVLKREVGTVGALENTTPGVQIRDRGRDFLRDGDDDSNDDDDSDDDDSDDDDSDDDNDDDDDDDDDNSGSGGGGN